MQILVKGCYYSAWEFLGGGYSCWQLMFSINHTFVTSIISVLLGLANICIFAYMGFCPLKCYFFSFNVPSMFISCQMQLLFLRFFNVYLKAKHLLMPFDTMLLFHQRIPTDLKTM